jgi:chitinase
MQKVFLALTIMILAFAANRVSAKPDRIVLGYSATWRDADSGPECYDFDAITHLARAFLTPHPDGTIEVPPGYFNPTLESLARLHGVKLLMSLGGEASNAENWLSIARHPEYFDRFCADLAKLLNDHNYDGIDIDWEPSATTTEDGQAFNSFMSNLRARFARQIISTALGASEYWIGHFNWKQIADNVDYVNVMTYDYSGGWGGQAAFCSNLFPASVYTPKPTLSVAEGMNNLIQYHAVPPGKLLLGITFWPSRFAVDHIGDRFPVNAPGWSTNITYAQAMSLLHTSTYTDFWDDRAATPYMERKAGGSVVVYESPRSIRAKCEYAAKLGCAGVMIWHLGADLNGDKTPLMDAVAQSVGADTPALPREAFDQYRSDLLNQIGQLDHQIPVDENASQLQLENRWAWLQDQQWTRDAPKSPNAK